MSLGPFCSILFDLFLLSCLWVDAPENGDAFDCASRNGICGIAQEREQAGDGVVGDSWVLGVESRHTGSYYREAL